MHDNDTTSRFFDNLLNASPVRQLSTSSLKKYLSTSRFQSRELEFMAAMVASSFEAVKTSINLSISCPRELNITIPVCTLVRAVSSPTACSRLAQASQSGCCSIFSVAAPATARSSRLLRRQGRPAWRKAVPSASRPARPERRGAARRPSVCHSDERSELRAWGVRGASG